MVIYEDKEFKSNEDFNDTKLYCLPIKVEESPAIMMYYCNNRYSLHPNLALAIIRRMGLYSLYEHKYSSKIPPHVFLIHCGFVLIDIYFKTTYNVIEDKYITEISKLLVYDEKLVDKEYLEWAKDTYQLKDDDISECSEDYYKSQDKDIEMIMKDDQIKRSLDEYKKEIIANLLQSSDVKGENDGR